MITDAYVTTIIAQAQRAAADYLYQAALLSSYGNDPDSLYAKGALCLDGAENLQAINDLTDAEKQIIIDRLLLCGGIAYYSAVPITFGTVTVVYPPSLSAKLSTLTDGPNTGTLVGVEYRIPAVKSTGLAWEFKKPGFQGTVIYVSPSGISGESEKGNIVYHYPTIALAETAASSGDTIEILPGTYTDTGLGKDGVTYHFHPGAVITTSGSGNIFNLSTAITVKVTGKGVFNMNSATANAVAFKTNHASANLYVEFLDIICTSASKAIHNAVGTLTANGRKINSSGSAPTILLSTTAVTNITCSEPITHSGNQNVVSIPAAAAGFSATINADITSVSGYGIKAEAGTTGGILKHKGRIYSSGSIPIENEAQSDFQIRHEGGDIEADAALAVAMTGSSNALIYLKGKIINNYNNASGSGVYFGSTGGIVILDDLTIILTHASAYPVTAPAIAVNCHVLSARTNSSNIDADVTYLVNNIQIDSNIIE